MNSTKHHGYNIAFGIIGPIEDDGFGSKVLPYPRFYAGAEKEKRVAEMQVAGYPAYIMTSGKNEVNYFAYGAVGAPKDIAKTEYGGMLATYDDTMATTGQDGAAFLARENECFDWDCLGVHNGFHAEAGVYTATIITEEMLEEWIMPTFEKYKEKYEAKPVVEDTSAVKAEDIQAEPITDEE